LILFKDESNHDEKLNIHPHADRGEFDANVKKYIKKLVVIDNERLSISLEGFMILFLDDNASHSYKRFDIEPCDHVSCK
jgi:hypothetical protein